jgi:hypothetical protein
MRLTAGLTTGICGLSIFVLAVGGGLTAGEKKGNPMIKVGDKAPAFESADDSGKTWKSTEHIGKKIVVLYFFPAALTGG